MESRTFPKEDGKIILFYKVGKLISEWVTWYMESEDEGHTFSEPQELVPGDIGGRGPVKNKPIRLSDGTVLAPDLWKGNCGTDSWISPKMTAAPGREAIWCRCTDWRSQIRAFIMCR